MKEFKPCEIVIRYNPRQMPPTALFMLQRSIERVIVGFTPKLNIRVEKVETNENKVLEYLIIQAKVLGFDYVDLYVPDKKSDEVVAFTFSKSKEYSEAIQNIELEK